MIMHGDSDLIILGLADLRVRADDSIEGRGQEVPVRRANDLERIVTSILSKLRKSRRT